MLRFLAIRITALMVATWSLHGAKHHGYCPLRDRSLTVKRVRIVVWPPLAPLAAVEQR